MEEALETAALAMRAGVDWLEAGTPFILAFGLLGVQELRKAFPGVPIVAAALSRHAPDVPVQLVPGKDDDVMRTVVSAAAAMAAPGNVVLLAPAAASLDMFLSYAARGNAFATAVRELPTPGEKTGVDQ